MKTKIVAEFASSWNADPDLMRAMVKSASENGADICKLQDYRAKNVPDTDPDKARYEKYQMRDELYQEFLTWCKEYGVEPLTSVFNADRAEFVASLGFKKVKIASVCMTNHELLKMAGAHFDEVIVSTGMWNREEIEEAADLLSSCATEYTLMACTAEYPMDAADANLCRIDELKEMLAGQEYAHVGYSDHALDLDVAKAAITRGVEYIEKHFTLSRYLPQTPHQMYSGGPHVTTHQVAIEPHELRELAKWRDKVAIMEGERGFVRTEVENKICQRYLNRYGV